MDDIITLTIGSTYNAEDCFGSVESAIEAYKDGAQDFGIELFDFKVDDDQEIITASVQYSSVAKLKEWIMTENPEFSPLDVDDLLSEAGI